MKRAYGAIVAPGRLIRRDSSGLGTGTSAKLDVESIQSIERITHPSRFLMSVPGFQSWFLPLLRKVSDGQIHRLSHLYEDLAAEMGLSEEDMKLMLPSAKQLTYRNRIGWARTYLVKAGLLEKPQRAHVRITQRGLDVLANDADQLDVSYLKQFPEFRKFQEGGGGGKKKDPQGTTESSTATPEEALEEAHLTLKESVTQELLERIMAAPPAFFEELVVELLLKMGYGGSREDAGQTIGGSGDGGVDGVIKEDRLGLDMIYVQAKRWEGPVGRPIVQAFAGSLEGHKARKGVIITTSRFTKEASEFVSHIEKKIVLLDGEHLADLMFELGLGVSTEATYDVKRIDSDYFEEM